MEVTSDVTEEDDDGCTHRDDILDDGFVGGHLGAVDDRHVGTHPRHEHELFAFRHLVTHLQPGGKKV